MINFLQKMSSILTALLLSACANQQIKAGDTPSSEAGRTIDIQVMPYYSAYHGKVERINVHRELDPLLITNRLPDYQKAVNIAGESAQLMTPMTMFVLAARSYDFGLRDEAVKWFYRGQNRLITALYVLDLPKRSIAEYTGFSQLVGRFINSYAFCNLLNQRKLAEEAIEWTKAHPYQAIFLAEILSKHKDRKKALKEAEAVLDKRLAEQDAYFSNQQNKRKFEIQRQENQVTELFCR
ncbi:hypothetical protein [Rodentibacter caecimuris]|uniref:Lipoprotein n=1 Tax=Rodentibacter caecimuris TaxID=1796644 RepID=A0ABX3KWQ2_9PAST|nr:hypothetical protein BKG89_08245 [Rodentibacter heylii]